MGRNERRCHEGTLFVAVALARRGERGSRSGARRCGAGDDEVSAPPPKMSGVAQVHRLIIWGKASCSLPPRAKGTRRPPWAVHRTAHRRAALEGEHECLGTDRPIEFEASAVSRSLARRHGRSRSIHD